MSETCQQLLVNALLMPEGQELPTQRTRNAFSRGFGFRHYGELEQFAPQPDHDGTLSAQDVMPALERGFSLALSVARDAGVQFEADETLCRELAEEAYRVLFTNSCDSPLARVVAKATELYGDSALGLRFMNEPQDAFNGETAKEVLQREGGMRCVEELLSDLEKDPRFPDTRQEIKWKEVLLQKVGGLVHEREVARKLRISRANVDERRLDGFLIAVRRFGCRHFGFPTFQFNPEAPLLHLQAVLGVLKGHDPWRQLQFFNDPIIDLGGRSPLAALRDGNVSAVLKAAAKFHGQKTLS